MTDQKNSLAITDQQIADALLRMELYFFLQKVFETVYPMERFQPAAYLEAMCKAVQDVVEGNAGRLLVNIPPRYMKSTVISVALVAFCIGRNPGLLFMVATYSADFASRHANQFRQVVESDWYRRLFPQFQISRRDNRVTEVLTTMGGGRIAVSVDGSVTGRGADVLIIDDIMKASEVRSDTARRAAERFYEGTLVSRLNSKATAPVIVVQQRLHEDDFSAYLLRKGNYQHLNMPAIAQQDYEELPLYGGRTFIRRKGDALFPEREDLATLERTRSDMGDPEFWAQYLQDPVPEGGNDFNFDLIRTVVQPPARAQCAPVAQSWDPAFTTGPNSAFSVCTTWGYHAGKWYLLDVWRGRLTFPELQDKVIAHKARWNADHVIVEGAGSGIELVQQLRRDRRHLNVMVCKLGVGNKEERLIAQSARLIGGDFVIPSAAEWFRDLRHEFRAFPNGKYSDQVDSVTQFVAWAKSRFGSLRTRTAATPHGRMEHEINRR
jgi:predicted phage terminase large subunit-like protein